MPKPEAAPAAREQAPADRNQLEIIRFPTREAHRQAIRVLVECGKLNYATNEPNVWTVTTDVVRALQEKQVSFEWLTGNQT